MRRPTRRPTRPPSGFASGARRGVRASGARCGARMRRPRRPPIRRRKRRPTRRWSGAHSGAPSNGLQCWRCPSGAPLLARLAPPQWPSLRGGCSEARTWGGRERALRTSDHMRSTSSHADHFVGCCMDFRRHHAPAHRKENSEAHAWRERGREDELRRAIDERAERRLQPSWGEFRGARRAGAVEGGGRGWSDRLQVATTGRMPAWASV